MYSHSILILALAAMSADVVPLAAHDNDRMFPISYLSDETLAALDQDDASVEDWVETVGEPTLTLLDFDLRSSYTQVTSYDPSNLDFRIWLEWSRDGKIHVAGQFAGDVYYNEYDAGPSNVFAGNDYLNLTVDGDHTGGIYVPYFFIPPGFSGEEVEDPLEPNMQAQSYQAISHADGDPLVDLFAATLFVDERWMVEPPFARGGGGVFGENPAYWSVKFYVTCFDRLNHLSPGDSDVSQLTEGKIIGLDIWVFDIERRLGTRGHVLFGQTRWLRETRWA